MNRRGFLSRFLRTSGNGDALFLGMQLVLDSHPGDPMRRTLHTLIEGTEQTRPDDKRAFYKRLTTVLLENAPFFQYGFWDYIPDTNDAPAEFDNWRNDIEGNLATEHEEIGTGVDELYRMSSDAYYIVVTLFFLLEDADALEHLHTTVENIPEEELFRRETFQHLLEAIRSIDFHYCLRDAVYLMPANDSDGFSWEDLHGGGWEYLRSIA